MNTHENEKWQNANYVPGADEQLPLRQIALSKYYRPSLDRLDL